MSCYHQATTVQIIQQLKSCKHFISAISRHANLFKFGLLNDTITTNHLLSSYARSRRIEYAHQLFDEMPEPNVVSWTSLISGYVNMGRPQFPLWLYTNMLTFDFFSFFRSSPLVYPNTFLQQLRGI